MEAAYSTLLSRPVRGGVTSAYRSRTASFAKDGKEHPRLITLGGDHTIVLPILRSLNKVYGPVSVIHFDAHLDTWAPQEGTQGQERITHGSFFSIAADEHLMTNTSIHAGIRCKMSVSTFSDAARIFFKVHILRDRKTLHTMTPSGSK